MQPLPTELTFVERMVKSLPGPIPPAELRARILEKARMHLENQRRIQQVRLVTFAAAGILFLCMLIAFSQGIRLKVTVLPPKRLDYARVQTMTRETQSLVDEMSLDQARREALRLVLASL